MKTGPERAPLNPSAMLATLLDLRFLELDVLARDRVVLLLDQLVGHGARILLGDVIKASVRRGNELDLDGDRFGHVLEPLMSGIGRWPSGRHLPGNLASDGPKSRFSRPKTLANPAISRQKRRFL